MEKPADVQNPILDSLKRRWSPRAFSDRPVEDQKLRRLFEAARWAASSFNEQPWRFILATSEDAAAHSKALSCLMEANQAWAQHAPVLLLTFGKTHFTKNDNPNRCWQHDLGAAMTSLSIQATDMGLFVHQMAGVDTDAMRELYNVPEGYEPFAAAAIGYPGDAGQLAEDWMRQSEQAPRTRADFGDFLFGDTWGEASTLF